MELVRVIEYSDSLTYQNEINSWITTYSATNEIIKIEHLQPVYDQRRGEVYFTAIITYKKK